MACRRENSWFCSKTGGMVRRTVGSWPIASPNCSRAGRHRRLCCRVRWNLRRVFHEGPWLKELSTSAYLHRCENWKRHPLFNNNLVSIAAIYAWIIIEFINTQAKFWLNVATEYIAHWIIWVSSIQIVHLDAIFEIYLRSFGGPAERVPMYEFLKMADMEVGVWDIPWP